MGCDLYSKESFLSLSSSISPLAVAVPKEPRSAVRLAPAEKLFLLRS